MDMEFEESQYDYEDNYIKTFTNFQTLYFVLSVIFVIIVLYSARKDNISGQNRMRREYV
jgi:hypothetical protein